MELKLSLRLVELLMMVCFLSLQAFAGEALSDLELYGIRHSFLLLDNEHARSPTSSQAKATKDPKSIHYHKTHHAPSPSHHQLPKGFKTSEPSSKKGSSAPSPHRNGERSHHHYINRKRYGNSPSSKNWNNPKGHLPLPTVPHNHINAPSPSPSANPAKSPSDGCQNVKCTEPLTFTAAHTPCGCVLPIAVGLQFNISLYNFFPLVPELSREIARALSLDRTQVRVVGADAAAHQQEKTTVLINLVPLDDKFDADAAFSIYRKFWMREVSLVFGSYEVLYVHYTGLPPSPPSQPNASVAIAEGNNGGHGPLKPVGADITMKRKNSYAERNTTIIVVLSAVTAFVVIAGFVVVLSLSKSRDTSHVDTKYSGGKFLALRSKPSSGSVSFGSSHVAFAGSAKIFTVPEMERATDGFGGSRVLGEGGLGTVYYGVLDDARKVAVKVLKRGSREFLAEVEVLSRLHHRNLVRLIGICPEERLTCLVYELVPNGSVEAHLHGADKEVAPLDWPSRMKIALGAARGLAYLHEDSSPRVIHGDFKSSNVLLEHDFTPKVSDFGLARAAVEDESGRMSTHAMGTFGDWHALVKSDAYSYGVVLLELLTGRKPVDPTQLPGQENLVSWARPLLATKEGLEALIDPAIKPHAPSESFARAAAVAALLVHPEPSRRPFMGEVVQALRFAWDGIDGTGGDGGGSMSWRRGDEVVGSLSADAESKHSRITNELLEDLEREECAFEDGIRKSEVDRGRESESSFGRDLSSAPSKAERKKRGFWWGRVWRFWRVSEHEYLTRL